MPEPVMFGAPNGIMARTDELHTEALTRLNDANAEQVRTSTSLAKRKAAQEDLMMQTLSAVTQKARADGTATPEGMLNDAAVRLMDAGFYNAGGELATKAATIGLKRQQGETSAAVEKLRLLETTLKAHEDLGDFLANSTDQTSFDAAKMAYLASHPGATVPPPLQTYDPNVIDAFRYATKAGQAGLREEIELLKEDRRERMLDDRKEGRKFVADAAEARVRLRERLRANRAKSEGTTPVVGITHTNDVRAVQAELMKRYPGLEADMQLGKDLVPSAAYDIASEMQGLITTNRGWNRAMAMEKAISNAEERGSFQTTPGTPPKQIFGIDVPKTSTPAKTTYSRKGSAKVAGGPVLPLPPKGQPVPPGTYQTKSGIVLWDGKKGTVLTPTEAKSRKIPAALPDDGEDDGEEE